MNEEEQKAWESYERDEYKQKRLEAFLMIGMLVIYTLIVVFVMS